MSVPVIHWFRRDLRLYDNTALGHAATTGHVIPVYILSTWKKKHRWTGPNRQQFLCASLASLDESLRKRNSCLVIREGDAVEELLRLCAETGTKSVFFNRDPDPFGKTVEKRLVEQGNHEGITCSSFKDVVLHEPDELLTAARSPFRVYSPYGRAWLKLEKQAPAALPPAFTTPKIASLPLPTLRHWQINPDATDIIEAGESAARKRLSRFIDNLLATYSGTRNTPHGQTTSRLSQDLRWGLLSIREIFHRVQTAAAPAKGRESANRYLAELGWREFFMQILHFHPEVLETEFNPKFRSLPWSTDKALFNKWATGQTGFPIVDAGIRELLATGFMHNRVRMIVAMFLTKDLRLHWKMGESFFLQHLIDGELASNNGGWQWSAGTGADAAPYFRIQNPWLQTARFDPDGSYIKTWIPELRDVDSRKLQTSMPFLAKGYPPPMVDHAIEREKTLEFFNQPPEPAVL